MSLEEVPGGEIAAVVTYLEMLAAPKELVPPSPLRLDPVGRPQLDHYRGLFRNVGSPWLWFSRLAMSEDRLASIIADPAVEIYVVRDESGGEVGMLELDFRVDGECELAFVGLIPELSGQGHGRWLLAEALRLAWREGVSRVSVHTCTLDHPAALSAYRRAGFTAYKRAVERFTDPRLTGILSRDCAPQVPVVGTLTDAGPVSWA